MSTFHEVLARLVSGHDLAEPAVRWVLERMFAGELDEAESAALLVAWRMKGESAEELAAAALVLRERMIRLETGRDEFLDTCGTGGDDSGTFNISTAAAFVAAAAGCPVVKHGNRAVSSRSGSADVLGALGIQPGEGEWARRCLERAGLAFCFAPHFHPALASLAGLRRKLGIRTLFNCLGPLANPAGAPYQLLGVGRAELLDPMASALARLGPRKAILVHGSDGLDEVTLAGETRVREVRPGRVASLTWTPADFGLEPCSGDDLRADDPAASAAILREVFSGSAGPARRIVLANAAAALLAAERVDDPREGVARAAQAIDGGRVLELLELLKTTC